MNKRDYIRKLIKTKGYMSETQIKLELIKNKVLSKDIKKIIRTLLSKDFHKIEYTNSYVSQYTIKVLYFYNPKHKKGK